MNDEFQRLVDERGSGLRNQTREELLALRDSPIEEVHITGQARRPRLRRNGHCSLRLHRQKPGHRQLLAKLPRNHQLNR